MHIHQTARDARRLITPLMRDAPQPQHTPRDKTPPRTTPTATRMLACLTCTNTCETHPRPCMSKHAHKIARATQSKRRARRAGA